MSFMNSVRNPFRAVQCPFCFEVYYPGECAIWSSVNNKELVEAPKQSWKKAFRRIAPIRLSGKKEYVYELAQRKCPHCGELLPTNMDDPRVENYIIAIVGAAAAGKSHYIAAAIRELREQAQHLVGYTELTADRTTQKEYLDNYYGPLFREKRHIPYNRPTFDPTRKPLVYRMTLPVPGPEPIVRNVNLFLYDAAGEQIVNENQAVRYSRYLLHASAIIFLADPQKMDGIVRNLPFHLRPAPPGPNDPQGVDKAMDVLNNVLGLITRMKGLAPGTPLSLPIAVTVSKSDILKSLSGLANQPYFIRKAPPYYQKTALLNDLQVVNREVYNFLQKFGDEPLLYVHQRSTAVGYFAISATGYPKQPDNTYPAVEPVRCLDPLLWILWRLGILTV
jgi:GTPase SAR1 family protein